MASHIYQQAFTKSSRAGLNVVPLYRLVCQNRYAVLSSNGLLMLAHIERRKGDESQYQDLLNQAKSKMMMFDIKDELVRNAAQNRKGVSESTR